jgi:hypothetical protein
MLQDQTENGFALTSTNIGHVGGLQTNSDLGGTGYKKTQILLAEPARAVVSVFVFHGLDIAGYGVSHDLNAFP